MLGLATRVLRVQFAPPEHAKAVATDDVTEFVAYTTEFIVAGLVAMRADRMTDLLNAVDALEVSDSVVQWLGDGSVRGTDILSIERSSLVAVKADAPRGNPARRQHTRRVTVAAGDASFLVYGDLHIRRGGDARADLGRRPPMIPLTDATIRFRLGGDQLAHHADTLIVNRDVMDWMKPVSEEDVYRLSERYQSAGP